MTGEFPINDCAAPGVADTSASGKTHVGKQFQFVLLGAAFGTGNMGVAALASGTIAAVAQSRPGARILLFDYGREPVTHQVKTTAGTTTAELVNIRYSWKVFLPNNIARLLLTALCLRLVPSPRLREAIIRRNHCLRSLSEADQICSLAGGDSFSDIYGMGRLWYVGLPQILVLLMGKPLVLLPQTIGPFETWPGRAVAGFILRRAQWVYSRDETSLGEVMPLLGRNASRLRFAYDMGFALTPEPPRQPELDWLASVKQRGPLVGLNVSGLLLMGGYNRRNMFGLKSDYGAFIRKTIVHFVREQGATVLLIPHVFGADPESDTVACQMLYDEFRAELGDRLRMVPGRLNQHEIKHVIGQCDFFMGARMHACIAALSQAVPATCLAYSRKFIGVMQSVGCGDLVADMRTLDAGAILTEIRRTFAGRASIAEALRGRMPQVRESVLQLFAKGSPGPVEQGRECPGAEDREART